MIDVLNTLKTLEPDFNADLDVIIEQYKNHIIGYSPKDIYLETGMRYLVQWSYGDTKYINAGTYFKQPYGRVFYIGNDILLIAYVEKIWLLPTEVRELYE